MSARTLVLAALLALGGCAMGQKFGYSDAALTLQQVPRTSDLAVAVLDARSYVLQGRKGESFVGLSRGGYGNPFDVTTRSGAPLASEMADAIARSLGDEGRKIRVVKVEPTGGPDAARKALAATGAERLLRAGCRTADFARATCAAHQIADDQRRVPRRGLVGPEHE